MSSDRQGPWKIERSIKVSRPTHRKGKIQNEWAAEGTHVEGISLRVPIRSRWRLVCLIFILSLLRSFSPSEPNKKGDNNGKYSQDDTPHNAYKESRTKGQPVRYRGI